MATCGTAFGPGHIKMVRRMITDDGSGGEVIFTFDGDAAGQKAAMAAFQEDQRFVAQTFVAVAEDGMDPCDLRLHKGDAAVRSLIASRRPLFEFAIDTTLAKYDLATLEGRVLAMRAIAPIIAGIKDRDLRPAYMRKVSGQLGLELDEIQRAVAYAQNHPKTQRSYREETPAAPRYERLPERGPAGPYPADAPYDPGYDAPPPEEYPAQSAYAGYNAAAHPLRAGSGRAGSGRAERRGTGGRSGRPRRGGVPHPRPARPGCPPRKGRPGDCPAAPRAHQRGAVA